MNSYKLRSTFLFQILIIVAVNLLIYIYAVTNVRTFFSDIVPLGDPFTYAIGYFLLLDKSNGGVAQAFSLFCDILLGRVNWYWLQDMLVVLFNPFLHKSMSSLIFINFILYFIWTFVGLKLGREFNLQLIPSITFSLAPWLLPASFGFAEYAAPSSLGLDASFFPMLGISLYLLIIAEKKGNKPIFFLAASASSILAIFGRGNSLPVVALVLFPSISKLIIKSIKQKRYKFLALYLIPTVLGAVYYYWRNWVPITSYYTNHLQFVERHSWNIADAKPYLLNIPGFLFWRQEDSVITITITFLIHLIIILQLSQLILKWFKRLPFNQSDYVLFIGLWIYCLTFLVNILLFTDPLMNIYNALLIWRPMLLGILCVFFSMLARLKKGRHLELRGLVLVPIGIITVICLFFTSAQTPWQWKEGRPSSKELVETVNNLRSAKGVSLLWYRNINPQILDFYSIQSTGRSFPIYRGENYNSLWSPWDYSSENRKRVASEITEQFNNAELVLIPEYIDMYSPGEPYAMYKFKDLFNELYLAGALPDMEIIGKLRDSNSDRILILRKLTGKSKKEADKTWKPINRE